MKLSSKTIIFLIVAILLLTASVYFGTRFILLKGFTAIEEISVARNVARVIDALEDQIGDLNSITVDWSAWDDSYIFMADHDPEYNKRNLSDNAFPTLRINLVLYFDNAGQPVNGKAFDLIENVETSLPPGLIEYLQAHPDISIQPTPKSERSGLIVVPEGTFLISARPIITSNGEGPVRGTLIMGRLLDQQVSEGLAHVTHLDLAFIPFTDESIVTWQDADRAIERDGGNTMIKIINEHTIAGLRVVKDIYGQPALLLRIDMPREYYAHGKTTITYFIGWLALLFLISGIAIRILWKHLGFALNEQRATLARYRAVVEQSGEGIFLVDAASKQVLDANPAFQKLLGYGNADIGNLSLYEILGDDRRTVDEYVERLIHDRAHLTSEGQCRRKDDTWLEVEIGANPITHGDREVLCITLRDITERKQAQERIQYLAHFDALTSLPNRVLLRDRLQQCLMHGKRDHRMTAVIFLDLDRFKVVNDSLGHHAGDLLLQTVAERLIKCVREGDTVSRQGGDEFVVLLSDLKSIEDCKIVADKILRRFAEPFHIAGHELHTTTSMGISIHPRDGIDVETLLKSADSAMYQAKENGGNCYLLFHPEMNVRSFERLTLENALRQALEHDEFTLNYQPQVSLASGKIFGMEALLRWEHPALGQISPARFVPIAEDTGLIVPIGEWVMRNACRQANQWQEQGHQSLRIAVNLSARQFGQQNLVRQITRILEETGLPAHCLDIELTESMLMDNVAETIKTLHELKDMGVWISVDDFGTGYSSLAYLQRIPIHTIKIDRTFVRDISSHQDEATIAKAIITLAHSLSMEVIAEGVETEDQLAFLYRHHCDAIQGYYFSPPIPAGDFAKLLQQGTRLPAPESSLLLKSIAES